MTFLSSIPEPENTNHDFRTINYLRISVTDRCNLACRYCVPRDALPFLSHKDIARYEEILQITGAAAELGINKVRITGGEPLVRKGIFEFIRSLSKIKGIEDIAVTTNGVLLDRYMDDIIAAGIKRLNISLDTLKPERFQFISGKDRHADVWKGIMSAHHRGISPIKLNAVVLKGINDDEITDLASLAIKYPFHIRFIEYMPMGNSGVKNSQRILIPQIKQRIEGVLGHLEPVKRDKHDGPAARFKPENALGEIGFISPVSSHFCDTCNRLRLTSTGRLRPCLLDNYEIDILNALRRGADKEALKKIIQTAIENKPRHHGLTENPGTVKIKTQMSTIGG